jgi:Tol biopolymer transport system component/DNA-binding winged helix-turn-helix (wHTH) protein
VRIVETRANPTQSWRFGVFEVDVRAMELRRGGTPVKIREQSFSILVFLLEHPGELVTREDLRRVLWPSDTFVDFDHSLNTAVMKLREALGDSADKPLYIETIPKRGYRFIAPFEVAGIGNGQVTSEEAVVEAPVNEVSADDTSAPRKKRRGGMLVGVGACLLLTGAGWFAYMMWRVRFPSSPVQRSLARLTFDDGLQTGAAWSPDGRYIAYASDRGGKFDIWMQQISGGDPIQITKGPGHHWQPNWSPDGKYIAYRSEEGDGGIYIMPALGGLGQQRKIAPFGYSPQWSPNSQQILFQSGFSLSLDSHFYIAQLDGSAPHEVLAEWVAQEKLNAASTAWYPDGKRITFWIVGDQSPSPIFWTVPIAGGPPIKLDIPPAVQKELAQASGDLRAGQQWGDYPFSWSPSCDAIYFIRGYRGARNIWKLKVDPETMRATAIERLTTGPGPDEGIALSSDGKQLAFTAMTQRIQAWLFPFDAGTGRIKGNGTAITAPGRTAAEPVLSRDGTKVAYYVFHGEGFGPTQLNVYNEIWVKSLVDGSEAPVIADGNSRWFQAWSPDGKQLAYCRRNDSKKLWQVMTWSTQSREEQPLADLGGLPFCWDWSSDGKWLLAQSSLGTISLLPVASAPHAETEARKITSHPSYALYQAHMSPDGRWIVFEAVPANSPIPESSIFVVSASGGPWTRITDGRHWDDKPRWSPDGKTIYFVSKPGGFFNVWGIHFDPLAGKPVGQPFQVSHFDSPRLMIPRFIPPVGMSLTQDKLVLTISQESGNIWILDNVDR